MRYKLLASFIAVSFTVSSGCQTAGPSTANPSNTNVSANPPGTSAAASPAAPQQGMDQSAATPPVDPTSAGVVPADSTGTGLTMLAMDFHSTLLRADKAKLEPMLADNYTRTRLDGTIVNKTQELASLKKVEDMLSMEAQPAQVKGDTATVTSKLSLTSRDASGQKTGPWQTTDTFKKRGDRWLVVSSVEKKN